MAARAVPAAAGVNFGDLGFYSGGFGIPPGKYALEFTVQMYDFKNAQGVSTNQPKLGVVIKAHSLSDPEQRGDKAHSQFYGMGGSADKSFAPNPDTGKGLIPIPGGPATTLNQSTNWAYFLKSMYDCGLPNGVFTNDLSAIDGVHVVMAQIDEPEERKGFQSATAEVQGQPRKTQKIGVVAEILDDGKPWEGKGGIPAVGTAVAKAPVGRAPAHAAPAASVPKPAAEVADNSSVRTAAINAVGEILGDPKNLMGVNKVKLRTGAFQYAAKTYGDAIAQGIQNTIFTDEATFNTLLGEVGYQLVGPDVKPL